MARLPPHGCALCAHPHPGFCSPSRENFQRLQQDLAEMIMSSLESRSAGSGPLEKRKTLSTRVRRRETNSSLPSDGLPAYFDLAVTDNPSTYL